VAPAATHGGFIDVDPDNLSGSGTAEDPYIITNASELQAMEDDFGAVYRLGAEIMRRGPGDPASFEETTLLSGAQTTPGSLAGKIRVETGVESDLSADVTRSDRWNYSLAITGPENAEYVTVYLQSSV